jgi:hypothetical protein
MPNISSNFCYIGADAKLMNRTTTPSERKVTVGEERRKIKIKVAYLSFLAVTHTLFILLPH